MIYKAFTRSTLTKNTPHQAVIQMFHARYWWNTMKDNRSLTFQTVCPTNLAFFRLKRNTSIKWNIPFKNSPRDWCALKDAPPQEGLTLSLTVPSKTRCLFLNRTRGIVFTVWSQRSMVALVWVYATFCVQTYWSSTVLKHFHACVWKSPVTEFQPGIYLCFQIFRSTLSRVVVVRNTVRSCTQLGFKCFSKLKY